MESFKEKYLSLPPAALGLILVIVIGLTAFAMYSYYLPAELHKLTKAREQFEKTDESRQRQLTRIRYIEDNPIPEEMTVIPAEQLQQLADEQNEITSEKDKDSLVREIRETARRADARKIEIELGETGLAYVDSGNNNYRIRKQAATITFSSSYNGVSNFLFQLRAMGKMIELVKIEMNSEKYRGDVKAFIDVNLFFVEEQEAPAEEAAAGM